MAVWSLGGENSRNKVGNQGNMTRTAESTNLLDSFILIYREANC